MNDGNAQTARRILSMSLSQAQTISKSTNGKINTLRGIVIEYMNWYCLADDDPDRNVFPTLIEKSMGRERRREFFENLEIIICEKSTFQLQPKSTRLRSEEYRVWCTSPPYFAEFTEKNPLVEFSQDIMRWFTPQTIDTYFAMTYSVQMISTQWRIRVTYDKSKLMVYLAGAKENSDSPMSKVSGIPLQTDTVGSGIMVKDVFRSLYSNSPASLYATILNKHVDLLKEFLKNNPDLNIRDHKRRTLLHYSAYVGDIESTEVLIQKGVDIFATDDNGKTAFDVAFEGRHYEGNISVCSILIKNGISPKLIVWEVLIDYSLKSDNVTFLDLAMKNDISFIPTLQTKILRIPIKHQNPNVLRYFAETLDRELIRKLALIRDHEDKHCLDLAYETRNEDIISIVEDIVGNEFSPEFPDLVKNQDTQIQNNQENYAYNINLLKGRNPSKKGADISMGGDTGSLLPTTLNMLANPPSETDPDARYGRNTQYRGQNSSLGDIPNYYQGAPSQTQLPPIRRPSVDEKYRTDHLTKPNGSGRYPSPVKRISDSPPLKYPSEYEIQMSRLENNMESLLAALRKRREEEERKLKVQRENECRIS